MASKKKESEGIALLSMYNDEDDEMEDVEEPEEEDSELHQQQRQEEGGEDDYGTSPGTVRVSTPNNLATPQISESPHSGSMNNMMLESETAKFEEFGEVEKKEIDPLDKFLPPPPKDKCSEELQRKINKFLEYKKVGKSFNAEVRNRKDYRNPDFLLHAVRYQDIDQIGSCFSKDVFDPHGYDKSDYYTEIEADMKREMERKEVERKKNPKMEFVSGGTQPVGTVVTNAKINIPFSGGSAMAGSGLHSAAPASDAIPRDGRHNKKSKWDKVDGDKRNPVISGGSDAATSAHSALLSAANAGSGYMAFAQQKRREAEEKRSIERKFDRRS